MGLISNKVGLPRLEHMSSNNGGEYKTTPPKLQLFVFGVGDGIESGWDVHIELIFLLHFPNAHCNEIRRAKKETL